MGADIAFTLGVVATSRFILGTDLLGQSFYGVTVYWMVSAPIVVGIWRGPVPGALAGLLIGAVNYFQLPSLNPRAWVDLICLVVIPALGGWIADEMIRLQRQRDQSFADAAVLTERDRLYRILHDGVLQVLSMVEREGRALGGRGAELAQAAHRQETQLRAMLQSDAPLVRGDVDLVALLNRRATPTVSFSSTSGSLLVAPEVAEEIDSAVGEALTNVERHAGDDASAWILVEEDGDELVVSVRDNGVGMSSADVDEAVKQGRRGVVESIEGRVRALGGVASWSSKPGVGVEWEMRVPKEVGDV